MDMITFRTCENSLLIAMGFCEVLYATNQHLEIAMNIKARIQLQFTKNSFLYSFNKDMLNRYVYTF